jgi:cardiolipin synthase
MQTDLVVIAIYVYALVVIVSLIYEERDPSTTLAWILVLLLVPPVGIVLYALFGRDQRRPGARDRRRQEAAALVSSVMQPVRTQWWDDARILYEHPLHGGVARAVTALNGTVPLPLCGLEIHASGASKFARLIADIEAARHFIHLQYFIWESDDLTARVCEALAEKVRAGVEVRILYDWVGSAPYGKSQLKALVRCGAKVRPDKADWRKLNYRNHRKIAVIDGAIAYTGGMNMGAEYVDGGRRFTTWRDTHLRFGGPMVHDLHALFCARWYRVTSEDLLSDSYFPESPVHPGSRVIWAQLAFSGPESPWEALRHAFVAAIARARSSVRVQSPYFVPDQAVADLLNAQALAGVDVRLMMAGAHDKRLPWWAAFSYLDELLEAGGRVLQYRAGFMHAKALTIDGELAAIGTANFDIRSFLLHDELHLFLYDSQVAREQDALFDADASECDEITLEDLARIKPATRLRNAVARLFSRAL